MGVPSEPLPTLGGADSSEEPKVRNCLQELQTILTGNVDASNLAAAVTALLVRQVRGRVAADGTVATGSGFTASKTSTGTYSVSFSTPFTMPLVVPVAYETGGARGVCVATRSSTGFTVEIRNDGATLVDTSFGFIAVEE